jgi:hypothetical protein
MQQNDLEKFIHNNRDAFDDAYPSLKLWTEIERELDDSKPVRQLRTTRPWYQIAAAIAFLLSLGGVGGAYLSNQQAAQPVAQQVLDEIAPDFSEMAQYYNQRIDEKYAELTTYTKDAEIDSDLAQIDQAMLDLRAELSQAPPGREEQIVQQLIETYRLKLQILERVLDRIEESTPSNNTPNNNSNDETSI